MKFKEHQTVPPTQETRHLLDSLSHRMVAEKGSEHPPNWETSDLRSPSANGDAGSSQDGGLLDTGDEDGSSEAPESGKAQPEPGDEAASISFGALAKAQKTLGERERTSDTPPESLSSSHDSKRRLKTIDSEAIERRAGRKDSRGVSRTSNHAPTELSSKKAVSRARTVVPIHKIDIRDPRFEPLYSPLDAQKAKKDYAFLDTYRDSEIASLKLNIPKTKDPEAKEKLKRALLSMESRKKTQEAKDVRQDVLRRHRKEEKEKIEQGKRPFYLKKGEQKKRALIERFEGMQGRQADRVVERRRKKKAARERRGMPEQRRG